MSGAVLEARAVILGEDRTKAAFESIKARVAALTQQIATMDRAMGAVGKVAPAVDAVHVSTGRASSDMAAFARATGTVNEASRTAERSTATLTEALQSEMKAVQMASAALSEAGMPTGRLAAEQERLAGIITATTRAIERQTEAEGASIGVARRAGEIAAKVARDEERAVHRRREIDERGGIVHHVTGSVAGMVAAEGMMMGVEHGAVEGANLEHTRQLAIRAGIPEAEVEGISSQALSLSGRYKNVSQESLIELAKEVRSVMTNPKEVGEVMPSLAAAKSVLDGIDTSGEASGGLGMLVKGAENIGAAKNPERLAKLVDGYTKAIQVMGKTVTPEGIYDFDKYSKLAGAQLSDRFLMTTALSLSQEMKGSTAGKAVQQWYKQLHGGMDNMHIPVQEFAAVGLVRPQDIQRNKVGDIKGLKHGAKVLGSEITDPDTFVYNKLLPAFEHAGIKTQADQLSHVAKMFPNSGVADLIGKLIIQRESYEAHGRMYDHATGTKGADQMGEDPVVAFGSLTTQLGVFAGVLAQPAMRDAGSILTSVSSGLASLSARLSEFNKSHPELAPIIGPAVAAAGLGAAGTLSGLVLRGSLRTFGHWLGVGGEAGEAAGAAAGAEAVPEAVAGVAGAAAAGVGLPIMAAGVVTAGTLILASDPSKAIVHGGHPGGGQGPADVLPGLEHDPDFDEKSRIAEANRHLRRPHVYTHSLHILEGVPEDDPWLDGEQPAIERRARMSADFFHRDPEAARGNAAMEHEGPLSVSLDPNSKVQVDAKFEVQPGSELLRIIEVARNIIASGSASAGNLGLTSPTGIRGNLGVSYPQTGPGGRNGIGRM